MSIARPCAVVEFDGKAVIARMSRVVDDSTAVIVLPEDGHVITVILRQQGRTITSSSRPRH